MSAEAYQVVLLHPEALEQISKLVPKSGLGQTARETALATAAALAQPSEDPVQTTDNVLSAAERYLAFLRADS